MFPLWKKDVFCENLRLTAPFFEKMGVKQPTYSEVARNMLADSWEFAFGTASSFPQREYEVDVLSQMRGGGIFLTAHYGNFEFLGYKLAELGLPLNAMSVQQRPAFFDNYLQKKRSFNGKCFAERKSPKEILQFVGKGGLFALLADQDFRKAVPRKFADNCRSGFLGVPVFCNPLPLFILEHFPDVKVFFGHSLSALQAAPADAAKNLYHFYNAWLENVILENPAKWYGWFHRRFVGITGYSPTF